MSPKMAKTIRLRILIINCPDILGDCRKFPKRPFELMLVGFYECNPLKVQLLAGFSLRVAMVSNPHLYAIQPFGRGPTTPGTGDLRSPSLLTTYKSWDDPPSVWWLLVTMGENSEILKLHETSGSDLVRLEYLKIPS